MQLRRENFAEQGDIDAILKMRRIAVVGLSSDRSRDSFRIAHYLQKHGYEITPINPNETEVLGVTAYDRVQDMPEPPEVVDVFRRPEFVAAVVDDAIEAGYDKFKLEPFLVKQVQTIEQVQFISRLIETRVRTA